jgi:UDP-N-acetylmuramate-alanine ligase
MVCLLDVYEVPGRDEIKIKNPADSFALASAISQKGKDARHFNPGELIDFLKLEAKSNDAIIFMGAGNVYKITASLFEKNEF